MLALAFQESVPSVAARARAYVSVCMRVCVRERELYVCLLACDRQYVYVFVCVGVRACWAGVMVRPRGYGICEGGSCKVHSPIA